MAIQVVAQLRVAEGWSVGNVLGALLLATLVLGAAAYAVSVTLRR